MAKEYVRLSGNETIGIPPGSLFKIVALSNGAVTVVAEGEAEESIGIALDKGKYVLMVRHKGGPFQKPFKYSIEFLQGITKEQFDTLEQMTPKMFKSMMTTEGTVFRCQMFGCTFKTQSRQAAVLHEADHAGVDIFKGTTNAPSPIEAKLAQEQMEVLKKEYAPTVKKQGRPPKHPSLAEEGLPPGFVSA